ncbi:uncharacterized protein [Hyperolius riggenbachi]|uniref:uncharacterized protein n=1 Tax=Hyperolius riggenbachi TaxID=752182 RepID=UPI0035A348AB
MQRGKKKQNPEISLHFFPKDLTRIMTWLRNANLNEETIEKLAPQILADTRCDKYRMCSAHFTTDSFYLKGTRKLLKDDAVPTIFQDDKAPPRFNPWLFRTPKRPKFDATLEPACTSQTCTCTCHQIPKKKPIMVTDSSTQTDPTYFLLVPTKNPCVMQANLKRVALDHGYSKYSYNVQPLQSTANKKASASLVQGVNDVSAQDSEGQLPPSSLIPSPIHGMPANFKIQSYLKTDSDDILDNSPKTETNCTEQVYSLETARFTKEQSSRSLHDTNVNYIQPSLTREESIVKERKFIVFESCLDKLLFHLLCPTTSCNRRIKGITKQSMGSLLVVYSTCEAGHQSRLWESQPMIKDFGAGNLLLAASIVLNGASYTEVKEICNLASIQIFEHSSFRQYQDKFIFRAIDYHWIMEKTKIKEELGNKPLYLAGNIRCESPGDCAEYCTCTLMDRVTKKIIDFEICQVPECTSSLATEKHAFHVCLDRIVEENFNVHFVGTDVNPEFRKLMATRYDNINHQFDLWHYAKSLKQQLLLVAEKPLCDELTPWIGPIITHFYWCSRTCCGREELFKEKWESLLHHITNEHSWIEGDEEKGCEHGPLTEGQQTNTWLDRRSPAFQALSEFVYNPKFEEDIPHLVYYCQTGFLETFQSPILKFCQKSIEYSIDTVEAQTKIAVISHNGVDRKRPTGPAEKKVAQSFPALETKSENETISTDHLSAVMADMIRIIEGTITISWLSKSDSIPQNVIPPTELNCQT